MLLRPARDQGFEVLMLRRSSGSAFAPDAFVFPGGTVDPEDASDDAVERTFGTGLDRLRKQFRATIPQQLPSTEAPVGAAEAAALYRAAIRELFEEAGILIARTSSNEPISLAAIQASRVQRERERLRKHEETLAHLLQEHDWFADANELTLFSHWITPPTEPRRFNTHFFIAPAPHAQDGRADAYETHDEIWISPARALERNAEGTLHMIYPTKKHLERLQAFRSVDELMTFAQNKPIQTIMPWTSPDEGFVMPAELEGRW